MYKLKKNMFNYVLNDKILCIECFYGLLWYVN